MFCCILQFALRSRRTSWHYQKPTHSRWLLGSFTKESPWMKLNKIGEVWNSANGLLSDLFGFLSSNNFATIATWRNDFSSLLVLPIDNKTNKKTKPFWSAPDEKNQPWTGFKPITSGSFIIRHLHISHNAPYLASQILHKHCFQFLLGRLLYPGEMKNKGWGGGGPNKRCIKGDVEVVNFINNYPS